MTSKTEVLYYHISSLPNSYIPKIEDYFKATQTAKEHKISAFNEPILSIKEPKISQWDYLDQEKVESLLKLKTQKDIFDFIASNLKNYPKGRPKDLFVQLLSDVTKFSTNHEYDVEKSATLLSQFYLTHIYFTSGVEGTAEKVYIYFKDLMMCHSLPFPPSKKKVFTLKEARYILEFFCKIYLRNLPLIKYLCLPNFSLYLNYEIPPLPMIHIKDKKKKNKGKEKAGKKGKK